MFTRDRTRSASVYIEPFGTDPGVDMEPFGTSSEGIQNWTCKIAGPVFDLFGPVPEWSQINRRPTWSDFWTRSIWICLEPVPCKHSLSYHCRYFLKIKVVFCHNLIPVAIFCPCNLLEFALLSHHLWLCYLHCNITRDSL